MTVWRIIATRIVRTPRTWALALLPALGVLVVSFGFGAADPRVEYGHFARNLLIPIVVAVVALVIATSAVGDERDDLTILYLAQTPLSRWRIVVETWMAAVVATVALVAVPLGAALVLGRHAGLGAASGVDLVVASMLAICAYCAAGTLLALLTRRAALIGVMYVLIWEGTLSGFAAGARNLSIAQHARSLIARSVDPVTRAAIEPPTAGVGAAVVVLVLVAGLGLALARRRLARMDLP